MKEVFPVRREATDRALVAIGRDPFAVQTQEISIINQDPSNGLGILIESVGGAINPKTNPVAVATFRDGVLWGQRILRENFADADIAFPVSNRDQVGVFWEGLRYEPEIEFAPFGVLLGSLLLTIGFRGDLEYVRAIDELSRYSPVREYMRGGGACAYEVVRLAYESEQLSETWTF